MTEPITKIGSCYRMNIPQFNAMLRSARDMLARYHAGAEFDPETVKWAQALTAANPVDKRRPSPMRDRALALFEDPQHRATGLTVRRIAELAHVEPKTVNDINHRGMLHKGAGYPPLYFLTAEAAAASMPPPKPEKQPKIPRLAKTPRPRQHVKREIDLVTTESHAAKVLKRPTKAQQIPQAMFKPKKPAVPPLASGSVFIPPSPTIDPNDPRIQRAPTPKGQFEVTEADLKIRIFGGTVPGTNPMTGRAW